MTTVLNRTSKEVLTSVNTPEYPVQEWIHDPDLSAVDGVDVGWWVIEGDDIREATTAEKNALIVWYRDAIKLQGYAMVDGYLGEESDRLDILFAKGNQDCIDHIAPYNVWRDTVYAYMTGKANDISAAATVAAVDVIVATVDLSTFDAGKPLVSYESALGAQHGVG